MSDNKEQTHSRRLISFVLHADGPLDEQFTPDPARRAAPYDTLRRLRRNTERYKAAFTAERNATQDNARCRTAAHPA